MTISVVEFIQSFRSEFFDFFFSLISFLGEEYVYILIFAVVYYAIDKKMGEFLAFSLFVTAGINTIIKGLVGAQRPFEKYPDRVDNLRPDTATGHSFPSGHTQNFTTFTMAASIYLKRNYLFIIAGVLSVLMAISRMYLGVHFLEDVLVSLVLGTLLAFGFNFVYNKYIIENRKTFYLSMIMLFTPFLFFIRNGDFYTSYGLILGFAFAMIFEERYVDFTISSKISSKVLRVLIGLIIMLGIQVGLKEVILIFVEDDTYLMSIFDLIRYFLIAFIGLGVYPMLFNKIKILGD